MIVAFDLDDTLYPEITYVQSGFRAVARTLEDDFGLPAEEAYAVLLESLERSGRGRQFDAVLEHWGLHTAGRVAALLAVYRHHEPDLQLPEASARVLETLTRSGHRLYLVTDGHKVVQARKVDALGLGSYFRHCYLTDRYGRTAQKPATRVFELMLARERAKPRELVYVADDPSKDFVGLRRMGSQSIRVLSGRHRDVPARPGFDAGATVERIEEVPAIVTNLSLSS